MSDMMTRENQGEGNREAAKAYNEATRRFIDEGKVEPAARTAAAHPRDRSAEAAGLKGPGHARDASSAMPISLGALLLAGAAGYLVARLLGPHEDRSQFED